jgi:ATP-dependent RNA helicase DDX24/MAK5
VGGLSEQKQKRVLDVKRPPVLVGTPGRLWDLMSSGEHSHLANLKQLRFLVIDEADRMVSQGNFPQLERIFDKIQQANPSLEYMQAHAEEEYESDSDDEDRLQSLPGIRGEAKVQMLDDEILKMIDRQSKGRNIHVENDDERSNSSSDPDQDKEPPRPVEIDDEEYEAQQAALLELDNVDEDIESDSEDDTTASVKRQTFVFSATLTLPTSSHQTIDSQFQQKKGRKFGKLSIDGAIAEILEKVGAQGQTKVVDLSTTAKSELNKPKKGNESTKIVKEPTNKPTVKLPPGLSLYEIRCTQRHKDSHLYSFLANTKQGSSGPCLVFCNSIGAVKRVGETLKILGLPVRMLHAQMQQKARLSSLESLSKSNHRSVVVATDVAARGLDIPSVASVVHYDVARAVDTFVHRAGRTARGMGEKAIGWSVSLVSAAEERNHHTICKAVQGDSGSFDVAPIDSRLLSSAQERVNLASKIFVCEDTESRTNKSNQWFINASNDAGLELDTDLLDDGQLAGSRKDRQQYLEAKRARNELKVLLAKPMRKQAFGKFLSNAGLRDAIQTEQDIKPYIVHETGPSKKRRKKQNTE